jgi:hypothetical protein
MGHTGMGQGRAKAQAQVVQTLATVVLTAGRLQSEGLRVMLMRLAIDACRAVLSVRGSLSQAFLNAILSAFHSSISERKA